MPGVDLDDEGRAQAEALAARLVPVPLDVIVTSPLDRCRQTAGLIAAARARERAADAPEQDAAGELSGELGVHVDDRVGECHYGDWTGKRLKRLAKDPLWRVVQAHPSAARFPGPAGEALPDMQYRAVGAVRDWNARLGRDACYLICSHGDVIKAIVADSLGVHLDQFQRIRVDPCSLTVIRYTDLRPFLLRLNDTGGDVAELAKQRRESRAGSDAAVGGGAGGRVSNRTGTAGGVCGAGRADAAGHPAAAPSVPGHTSADRGPGGASAAGPAVRPVTGMIDGKVVRPAEAQG